MKEGREGEKERGRKGSMQGKTVGVVEIEKGGVIVAKFCLSFFLFQSAKFDIPTSNVSGSTQVSVCPPSPPSLPPQSTPLPSPSSLSYSSLP